MVTAMPRSLVTFIVNQGVISAKPLNDQQTVQVVVDLPVQFAYRMINGELMIAQDEAFAYTDGGELQSTNLMRGQALGVTTRHLMRSAEVLSFATIVAQHFWLVDRIPTYIMQSISAGVAGVLDFRIVNNNAAAAAAGTLNFYASFFEYDIEQVQMFPPLIPTLTYSLA